MCLQGRLEERDDSGATESELLTKQHACQACSGVEPEGVVHCSTQMSYSPRGGGSRTRYLWIKWSPVLYQLSYLRRERVGLEPTTSGPGDPGAESQNTRHRFW